jgi:predicted phage-related endonuclease
MAPVNTDRKKWLAARRRGITGTDVAAILGLSPWKKPIDVYRAKVGEADEIDVTVPMMIGTALEPIILKLYSDITGLVSRDLLRGAAIAGAFPKNRAQVFGRGSSAQVLIRHKEIPYLLATPDAFIPARERGLEAKTAGYFSAWEWGTQGTDEIPPYYLTQAAVYLAVTDMPIWDVGALVGDARFSGDLTLYQVERTRALESEILAAAERFWTQHVQKKIPPPIDGSSSWQAYLAKKYGRSTGRALRATPQIADLAAQYRDAQLRRQEAEEAELLIRNQLAETLKGADRVRGDFGSIGWVRPGEREVTDWAAVARAVQASPAVIRRHSEKRQDPAYLRAWWRKEIE